MKILNYFKNRKAQKELINLEKQKEIQEELVELYKIANDNVRLLEATIKTVHALLNRTTNKPKKRAYNAMILKYSKSLEEERVMLNIYKRFV